MTPLPYELERTVEIDAPPDLVFRYFTDSQRWAAGWGAGSRIDARAGGELRICHPGGVEVAGEVLDVAPPERIVFTYGYASGSPIPVGASRVTIRLQAAHSHGTRLHLTHAFADTSVRDAHVQGWRYQVSLFGNVVMNELHADAAARVDGWFAAFAEADAATRAASLRRVASPDVRLRDRYSLVDGIEEVSSHLGAFQQHMPGLRFARRGDLRQCLGTAAADWAATDAAGALRASGTSVFTLGADGRIAAVTSFWGAT